MQAWQRGQLIRITNCTKRGRRACGRVRTGGKGPCRGSGGGVVGHQEGIAPDQTHQGEMTMQPLPGPALIVAQTQLLLAILMKAFTSPPPMRQARLPLQRQRIQAPGKVPRGLPLCWPLASSIGQTTPHDGQASCAHTTMILSNNKEANDMRSSRVPFDATASGHWSSHCLSPAMYE